MVWLGAATLGCRCWTPSGTPASPALCNAQP